MISTTTIVTDVTNKLEPDENHVLSENHVEYDIECDKKTLFVGQNFHFVISVFIIRDGTLIVYSQSSKSKIFKNGKNNWN